MNPDASTVAPMAIQQHADECIVFPSTEGIMYLSYISTSSASLNMSADTCQHISMQENMLTGEVW